MQDLKIHLLSDNSGYYVLGGDVTNKASICKYLFSSSITADCQQIPSFRDYPYCQLKITDSSFFIIGRDPAAEYDLHIYTFTFAQTSPTWSSRMVCPFNGCAVSISDALSESSKIYSLIAYGNSYKLYLTAFLSIDGSIISSRYKSNLSCSTVYGIAKSGDYIIASIGCNAYYLFIFNIATDSVTFKNYGGNTFYGITVDSVGRFVVGGNKAGHGYISRFTIQSTPAHPEFLLASPLTMSIIPTSTDSIFPDSLQTLGSPLPQSVSTYTPSFSSVTYVQEASYTSDVSYETNDETYSILKGTSVKVTPSLPCSSSGTTTISFSIGNYLTTAPSWVTIDSSTGELTIVAPDVSTNTEFDFYINSSVTGVTGSIQKLIKLIIAGCSLSNCSKCVSSNINKCEDCNSGYSLISDSCIYQSNTSQNSTNSSSFSNNGSNETNKVVDSINTSTISIVGATSCVAILMSLMNTSSMASLWSMVNQLQLYFLLILTRSFLPNEVISVIKGYKFTLNLYDYFPIRKIDMWKSLFNNYIIIEFIVTWKWIRKDSRMTNKLWVTLGCWGWPSGSWG